MPTPALPLARRLTAGVALIALPLVAAVGCGEAAETKKESVQGSLQQASDNLAASGAMSVVMRFDDTAGNAKKALTTQANDPATDAQADLLLGGRLSFTLDPADGKTLRDVQTADPAMPVAEQLKLVNIAMEVQADGGPLAQIRLVGGDLYASVGLDKIAEVAAEGGSTTDVKAQVQQFAQGAPPELKPLVDDALAGKWLKLPLAPYAEQLKALSEQGSPTPAPSVDPQKVGTDLLNAVKPFVTVSDASSDGDERVLDVKVQAKQAIKAAMSAFAQAAPGVPGLDQLDTSSVDRLGDGTVDGQVTLSGDHLTKMTMDLGSAVRLAPAGSSPAPDLAGALLTVDVDDSADEVQVPEDVSSADLGALVQQFLGAFSGSMPS